MEIHRFESGRPDTFEDDLRGLIEAGRTIVHWTITLWGRTYHMLVLTQPA